MKNSFSFHLATMFLLVLAIMPLSATAEPMAQPDAFFLVKAIHAHDGAVELAEADLMALDSENSTDLKLTSKPMSLVGATVPSCFGQTLCVASYQTDNLMLSASLGLGAKPTSEGKHEVGWRS